MSDGNARLWLVWSNDHRAWRCPDSMGYTGIIGEAGCYSLKDAMDICEGANEVRVLAPEAAEALIGGVVERVIADQIKADQRNQFAVTSKR